MAPRSDHATARASFTSSGPRRSSGRWHYPTAPKFFTSPISLSSPRGSTFGAGAALLKQVGSPFLHPSWHSPSPLPTHVLAPRLHDEIRLTKPIFSKISPVPVFHFPSSRSCSPFSLTWLGYTRPTTCCSPSCRFPQVPAQVPSRTPSPERSAHLATSIPTSFTKRVPIRRGESSIFIFPHPTPPS